MTYGLVGPLAQDLNGFVVELHGFAGLRLLLGRERGYPRSTARRTVVYIGNGCETWFHAPSMKIIDPVDVGDYFTDGVVENFEC